MDPAQPAPSAPDSAVEFDVPHIWQAMANAGARVPEDPLDLDLSHLAGARERGLNVSAMIDAATPPTAEPRAAA